MTESFIAPVPFKRVNRVSADAVTKTIGSGSTRDGKVFGVFGLATDPTYLQLQVTVEDGRMFRVGLASLVHQLITVGSPRPALPEDLAEHLDHVRAALSGMTYRDPRGVFSGLDVFGEALEAIEHFAATWNELPDVEEDAGPEPEPEP